MSDGYILLQRQTKINITVMKKLIISLFLSVALIGGTSVMAQTSAKKATKATAKKEAKKEAKADTAKKATTTKAAAKKAVKK
ncbi:MAG: hypothetical protein P4L28_10535 [Paludibacteraceae bacterium]|nr:hypothetical protein [Paludibacteraceae bacterium]